MKKGVNDVLAGYAVALRNAAQIQWPSEKYRYDPTAFSREVLGHDKIWQKQIEIMEAVRDCPRVSVVSGHKIGKSFIAGDLALWFYASFEDARVILTSTTDRQVNKVLWREIRRSWMRAKVPLDGDMHEIALSGLKSQDFREINGYTAKDAESAAGTSGSNILYIIDESSGVPDLVMDAIEGNLAAIDEDTNVRLVLFGNGTKTTGFFYDSHSDPQVRKQYRRFQISSEETPNVLAGRVIIPGLATRKWVEERKEAWGENSPTYDVRVRGRFPKQADMCVIGIGTVEEAEGRWEDTPEIGPLEIGVDVAQHGVDSSVLSAVRGDKQIAQEVYRFDKPDEKKHWDKLLAQKIVNLAQRLRKRGEPNPIVRIDSCGGWGTRVAARLIPHASWLDVVEVNVAERSTKPEEYEQLRDELWFNLAEWLENGGAIMEDVKLSGELTAPTYEFTGKNRRKVERKDDIRTKLHRSTDRADALALAVWRGPGSASDAKSASEDEGPGEEAGDEYTPSWERGQHVPSWER